MNRDWSSAIDRAQRHAPFLARGLERMPELADLLAAGEAEAALAWAKAAGKGAETVGVALRRERLALAIALAIGDLAGKFTLARVTGELSAFADRALDAAIADAVRHRVPDAGTTGFIALALGKHGAEELNYSSDIDPILLYDPALLARRDRDEPGEAAQRVARRIIETLSHVDSEGYVFRVDLRLRPAAEVSPLAVPLDAALTHYESSAQPWERAAFIRARACAGDLAAGEAFLAAIRPFVWRKSLDFGAITEIARLTARIRENHHGPARPGPGFNVKQGRGGIREVEFFAQTHQLIHGGRNPALRLRGTRSTLDALADAGLIDPADARILGDSYDRLRTVEHRLQMVADQQTHSLPTDPALLEQVAQLDGLPDGAALVAELAVITELVGTRYDRLIAQQARETGGATAPAPSSGPALAAQLAQLGFAQPAPLAERMSGWRGRLRALRSDAAREAYDAIQPALLSAFARGPEPDQALLRWEALLAGLPSAVNLFRLLEARPGLLELLAQILGLAPPLADELARRADLLDSLIDASAFDLPGSREELEAEFARSVPRDDYERLLDSVRRRVGERRFALGVQLVTGASDPILIGEALARIAEAALTVLAHAAIAQFERVHGAVPGSALVVLGLGRLGGGMLTHASDLDLVFLFSGEHGGESDGGRPLGATLYFNRLAQRVGAALSVPTAEGALYEVDTRLRPSGSQGPLAVTLESFANYQRSAAWTWDHMALARGRALFGPDEAQAALRRTIAEVLGQQRDPASLRADLLKMRTDMARHKPGRGQLDVKLTRGGLVDIEFIVHFLQLRDHQGLDPSLPTALAMLVNAGLLAPAMIHAERFQSRFLLTARLLAPDMIEPPPAARAALASACQCRDWDCLLTGLENARQTVALAWAATFDLQLELEP